MLKDLIQTELKELLVGSSTDAPTNSGSTHQIVICQRGFVFAGDVRKSGADLVIENAVNIRKWGTTKGLGELAEEGTLPDTKTDEAGTVRVHELAVVARLDCRERINATT